MNQKLTNLFQQARNDESLAVLEGFHAVKHALRFGAEVLELVAVDADSVASLAEELAPDVRDLFLAKLTVISPVVFDQLSITPPRTGIMAIAKRRADKLTDVLKAKEAAPLVFLEDPRDLGNIGAVVRVAAAAGAAGVLTSGPVDPWHPNAIRGSAGLHYALPVLHVNELPDSDRQIVAIHPEGGIDLKSGIIPDRSIMAFGTERNGLSKALLARADLRISIPMQPNVSSLNLATAVAVVLYAG